MSKGIKCGLMSSRARCRLPLRQGLSLPAAPGGKLDEAAQSSHSGPKSQSQDLTPGRQASGSSAPKLLYFAEESMGGSPPEARAGRTKEGLSGCLETLSLVFLQPVRGALSWKAGHG